MPFIKVFPCDGHRQRQQTCRPSLQRSCRVSYSSSMSILCFAGGCDLGMFGLYEWGIRGCLSKSIAKPELGAEGFFHC